MSPSDIDARLAVACAPAADRQLAEMRERAERSPDSRHGSAYRSVVRIITDIIGDSRLAFLPQHHLRGELHGVLRVKAGRLRVFFIASEPTKRAIVLYLGYRKEGDKHDAYEEIKRLIRRGSFDPQFAELGIAKPKI